MTKTGRLSAVGKVFLALVLTMLAVIGFAVTASADDLVWNLLEDKAAGYEVVDANGKKTPVWLEKEDAAGKYLYNDSANGRHGALYIYDRQNILGSYQTFSVEGDFYFESFPSGVREEKYTPEDRPLSFIGWLYDDLAGNSAAQNSIRLDSEGYVYTGTTAAGKTDLQLRTGKWYNIRCVFTPKSGQCELYVDGEKELNFMITAFDPETLKSGSVRYFDSYYNWSARMKNLLVKTDSDYVIGERVEEAADFVGYQTSKPENGSFDIRAILGVNDTAYNRIGYEVITLGRDDDGNVITEIISKKEKVVYESVKDAAGKTYSALSDFGYNYVAAVEIEDIPVSPDYVSLEIVVRPYVLGMDGIRLYGDATILIYSRETDAEGYPLLTRRDERFFRVNVTDDTMIYDTKQYRVDDFADEKVLHVKNTDESNRAPQRAAYFKFTLTPEQAKIVESASSAKLYVCVQNLGNAAETLYDMIVHGTDIEWDEHSLNAGNVSQLAPTWEYVGQSAVQDDLYFSVDVLDYLFEQALNDDGSMTVSFRLTTEGHSDARLVYLHSKESSLGLVPYIEIVSTLYDRPLNIEKYGNDGYEPWGYAEYLVDEWFYDLRDKIWPRDEQGNSIYHDIDAFNANGYNATEATGDFTREMPWSLSQWSLSKNNNYTVPVEQWNKNRFARTLSTLGTSTANAFLSSKYADQIAEYDIYGGITNAGFTGEATGFFHIETHGGRPYIIDPLGNPYFAIGINEVNIRGTENQQDYALAKFGTKENYFEEITDRLQDMGVNTAYESTLDAVLAVEDGLSVVLNFGTVGAYMKSIGRSELTGDGLMGFNNTRCIFEPGYERETNKTISRQIEKYGYADNSHVFGYTTDNELPSELTMLENYLTLDPTEENTNAFSYATAWTWLARRMDDPYPTLEKLAASPELEEIRLEFLGFWYARYYKVVSEAIHAADPNHLYMGSRSNLNALTEEWIIRAQGYYTDVITANLYGGLNPSIDTITNLYRYSGKPFIVTEFFAKGADSIDANGYKLANSTGAGILVQTQQDRADYYEHYALALLESKACVGWTWYRMRDNDQSLFNWIDQGKTVYMAYVVYGVDAGASTYADKDGKLYSAEEVGKTDRIYSGDAIASNQNVNKGVFNSTFNSVATVYVYDKNGKLLSSSSCEVQDPSSATPAEGTVLRALDRSADYTLGKTVNADGSSVEIVLTVYKGTYVAFADAIKSVSSRVMGIVNYFDAK